MKDPSLTNRCAKERRAEVIQGYGCELFADRNAPKPEPEPVAVKPRAKR